VAGLPLAVQLVGGPGRLGSVLGAATWIERLIDFQARPPQPIGPNLEGP
jgi:Asp-tRNA(Asn)/Glu-tRNA(Gln) amidotransferase A subunit family amidase